MLLAITLADAEGLSEAETCKQLLSKLSALRMIELDSIYQRRRDRNKGILEGTTMVFDTAIWKAGQSSYSKGSKESTSESGSGIKTSSRTSSTSK